jgi:hypothetical protein
MFPHQPGGFTMYVALLSPKGKKILRSRPSRFRPRVETLEARTVPSVSFKPVGIAGVRSVGGSFATSAPLAGFNVNTDTVDTIVNETSLAVNPTNTNNIIASTNDYQIDPVTFAETIISDAQVSFDGGNTWTVYKIPSRNYTATGDPAIAFDATGRVYAAFLGDFVNKPDYPDIWATVSNNGGKSWTGSEVISRNITNRDASGLFNDKEYIAAWGNGNAIITWSHYNLGPNGSYISSPIYDSITHDGGQSWSAPQQIAGNLIFDTDSTPVVAADGSIHVSFISGDGDTFQNTFRDSYAIVKIDPNTGAALGAPVAIYQQWATTGLVYDGFFDYPISLDGRETLHNSEFRTNAIGNLTADPTNAGHLAMVWSDMRNSAPQPNNDPYNDPNTNSDVIVSQSFDGGQTWSSPIALTIANDQFQPWAAYDRTGRLQIGYYDRSYDPSNEKYGYSVASETTPGSLVFTTQEVSTALSDPTKNDAWFRRNGNAAFPNATGFLGDYSNITILGNGNVGAFWTDMRNPSGFPGRATLAGEQGFFGDPQTGSSSNTLVGAMTPSHAQATVTNQSASRSLDSYYTGLADSLNLAQNSSSQKNSSSTSLSPAFLAHLREAQGFDWLDDSDASPLD